MIAKRNKAQTFIGFAVRKNAVKINVNTIATLKKAFLLVVCSTAGENTKKKSLSLSKRFNCDIITMTDGTLGELLNKENAKVVAITDEGLAKAIKEYSFEGFKEGV